MLKFTSVVGYTSCGPTYIERFLTIFGQCPNVLNYNTELRALIARLGRLTMIMLSSYVEELKNIASILKAYKHRCICMLHNVGQAGTLITLLTNNSLLL